jgi:pilus assembly protein Flp/PilA
VRSQFHPCCGITEMPALVKVLFRQVHGATALEYAFIASLISIAIYAAAITVGTNLTTTFTSVAGKL